jgi:23S rRNA pseudouridine1911/1915/1917 synthase
VIRLLPVPAELAGERADAAVARLMGLSRARAAELAARGLIDQDGVPLGKSARLEAGAILRIELPDETQERPPEPLAELPIAYEDDDILIVDKPVGVAAHASAGWSGPTVLGSLLAGGVRVARGAGDEQRGIVHRLDVGTTGLMLVAKSEMAYSVLKQMFRDRVVDKVYQAVTQGLPNPLRGTVDGPIGRLPGAFKFEVVEGGKPSITHYEVVEAFRGAALLTVRLETGRTHQIRVHLAAMGHPLVGDVFYGADKRLAARLGLTRQWLHAAELGFDHPVTGAPTRVRAPLPDDLRGALIALRES